MTSFVNVTAAGPVRDGGACALICALTVKLKPSTMTAVSRNITSSSGSESMWSPPLGGPEVRLKPDATDLETGPKPVMMLPFAPSSKRQITVT